VKRGKVFGLVGVSALITIGGYRAFGYKITPGNIFGVKVAKIALFDIPSRNAFDESGNSLSLDDPLISDTKSLSPENLPGKRFFLASVQGAKQVRIYFGKNEVQYVSSSEETYRTDFPLQDGNKTIPYRIEATADNWQLVDNWDAKSPSSRFVLDGQPGWSTIRVKQLPHQIEGQGPDEYKIVISPKGKYDTGENFCRNNGTDEISAQFTVQSSEFREVKVYRRGYRLVKEGMIAFGKPADAKDLADGDNQVTLESVGHHQLSDAIPGEKWTPEGKRLPFVRDPMSIDTGSIQPEKRHLQLQVLVGDNVNSPGVSLVGNGKIASFGYSRTGRIIHNRTEFDLSAFVDPSLKVADLDLQVTDGPYKEVLRTSKPVVAVRGTEKSGTAILEARPYPQLKDQTLLDFVVKIPDTYSKSDVVVKYIGSGGAEHYAGTMGYQNGYVGVELTEPLINRNEVQGIIVMARDYKKVHIPNVHLYPN
jgi:hypothetical protein